MPLRSLFSKDTQISKRIVKNENDSHDDPVQNDERT